MSDSRDPSRLIQTYSGKQYWPTDPRPEDVEIADIAHSLSMLCRYTGHTRFFYSVAEHSVLVSLMVPPELALEALLHDATEAYCADLSRPLKRDLPEYATIEARNAVAIRTRFRLPLTEHPLIKVADSNILHTEMRQLLPPLPDWVTVPGVHDPSVRLFLWCPAAAEVAFLNRYQALVRESGIRNS